MQNRGANVPETTHGARRKALVAPLSRLYRGLAHIESLAEPEGYVPSYGIALVLKSYPSQIAWRLFDYWNGLEQKNRKVSIASDGQSVDAGLVEMAAAAL